MAKSEGSVRERRTINVGVMGSGATGSPAGLSRYNAARAAARNAVQSGEAQAGDIINVNNQSQFVVTSNGNVRSTRPRNRKS